MGNMSLVRQHFIGGPADGDSVTCPNVAGNVLVLWMGVGNYNAPYEIVYGRGIIKDTWHYVKASPTVLDRDIHLYKEYYQGDL